MGIRLSIESIRLNSIVLLLLSRSPSRSMRVAQIIELSEKSNWVTANERASVPSRSDSRFANMIHNLISHRDSKTNPIRMRLIEWDSKLATFAMGPSAPNFLLCVAQKLTGDDGPSDIRAIEVWLVTFAATH